MNSTILSKNESYSNILRQFLDGHDPHWLLCYRASVHGWEARTFHSRCDGKRDTVTIIKSGKYVFGGYVDVPWGRGNTTYS